MLTPMTTTTKSTYLIKCNVNTISLQEIWIITNGCNLKKLVSYSILFYLKSTFSIAYCQTQNGQFVVCVFFFPKGFESVYQGICVDQYCLAGPRAVRVVQ